MKCNVRYLLSGLFFLVVAAGFVIMIVTDVWTRATALGEMAAAASLFIAILYFKNSFKK